MSEYLVVLHCYPMRHPDYNSTGLWVSQARPSVEDVLRNFADRNFIGIAEAYQYLGLTIDRVNDIFPGTIIPSYGNKGDWKRLDYQSLPRDLQEFADFVRIPVIAFGYYTEGSGGDHVDREGEYVPGLPMLGSSIRT